ncbi:MAG TPA: hypothetical protein VHC69_16420 [Polyangiaceae bacterium]|nr:hypothetical protein [Polyangiaceae bacterium]
MEDFFLGARGCLFAALVASVACSSSDSHSPANHHPGSSSSSEDAGPDGSGGSTSGHGSGGTSSQHTGGSKSSGGKASTNDASTPDDTDSGGGGTSSPIIHVPGTPDPNVKTALPPLPQLTNVVASAVHDDVEITFDPIDGAQDYRVYVLPDDSDVSHDDSGHVTVKNAIYRCSGDRQMPAATEDGTPQVPGGGIKTLVDGQDVVGYTRKLSEATLGYVYYSPGDGRVPVYAMGDPAANADNGCYFQRWGASRAKKYVVDPSERATLLKAAWRDDGVAFYVPSAASSSTTSVYYTTTDSDRNRLYYIDGPEAMARGSKQTAFQVLKASSDDTKPLMRVFYSNECGISHDELVAGQARFNWVRQQGDQIPVPDLHWAGITQDTTLVIEALQDGCPYQGFLAPISLQAEVSQDKISYPAWYTLSDLQKASSTGEVYVNGQHDAGVNPRPIARSFVKISPGPKPDMDWFAGFQSDDDLGALTSAPCGEPSGTCFQEWEQRSDKVQISYLTMETDRHAAHTFLGELWVAYADSAADRNGKFRLTPLQKATLNTDSYLHVTMTVDSFTTARRYPQFLISDLDAPVQQHMASGNTVVVETFMDFPNTYEVQVCDHQLWDVNNQCPAFDVYHVTDPNDSTKVLSLAPNDEVGEHIGMDRGTRFDVYASTKRIYMFLDDQPYGCAVLPTSGVPAAGPVTVTFGDVLYHSGVDKLFTYTAKDMQTETRHHYDNLGFKSGVAAPDWDDNRLPCVTTINK